MIRDEEAFAKKIKGYLDAGAADLRAGTAYRLQQARARALERLPDRVPVAEGRLAHALAGGHGQVGGGVRRAIWLGFAILAVAAFLFGYQQWQLYRETREIADLDVQILTSDLPIDAYVDRGFQAWLTRYEQ